MSETNLAKTQKTGEALGDKNLKSSADEHASRSVLEAKVNKFYPGPKLTAESLNEIDTTALRLPEHGHPDYSYRWLSTDARAVPHLSDALGRKGYTMCYVEELPEMTGYIHKTMENSMTDGAIVFKEMVLCKIHKEDLFQIMKRDHHDKPNAMAAEIYRGFNDKLAAASNHVVRSTDPEVIADERAFINSNQSVKDPQADGVITLGKKDIKLVKPKFNI